MIRAAPSVAAPAVSQLLLGEAFAVLDVTGGWAWGYGEHDRYVGYVPAETLGPAPEVSHVVTAPLALVFAAADIKAPVVDRWPIGARIAGQREGAFLACAQGYVHLRHVTPLGEPAADPVSIATRLLGMPYLWGGRGAGGIDCSGLVQQSLSLCGIAAPRDSDQQRAELGRPLPADAAARRGDFVFLPGHVGMMVDESRLIHANAFWMAVTVEPLDDVLARAGEGAAITRRRLDP